MNDIYEDEQTDRHEKKIPAKPIPQTHIKRFAYMLEEKSGEYKERNIMLYLLGISTGYRMQDLVCLSIGDIKEALEFGYFEIQEQKQYKSYLTYIQKNPNTKRKPPKKRTVTINRDLEEKLKIYIKNKNKSQYAFESKKGEHISAKSYSRILTQIGKELNLKGISGHSLRKTYARRIYERHGNTERVRQRLGHKSVETTKEYLGIFEEEMREDASLFDGIF